MKSLYWRAFIMAAMAGAARADGVSANMAVDADQKRAEHRVTEPGETIVALRPSAVVNGDQVRLSDVADIRGHQAQEAGAMVLGAAPQPGSSGAISLSVLQDRVRGQGANLGWWVFRGNTVCTITRPSTGSTSHDQTSPHVTPGDVRGLPDEMEERAPVVDPDTLAGALHAHIASTVEHLGGQPLIQYARDMDPYLGLSRPTYEFEIERRDDRLLGLVPLGVTIRDQRGQNQRLSVLARVALRREVVVAARGMNRKETISEGALGLTERVFDRLEDLGLTEMKPLIGQRVKRSVREGAQITPDDIEPTPLVHRNDQVTVTLRQGRIEIVVSARAQSSGGLGDTVELKTELARRSPETFTAVVTGFRTAEVQTGVTDPVPAPTLRKGNL